MLGVTLGDGVMDPVADTKIEAQVMTRTRVASSTYNAPAASFNARPRGSEKEAPYPFTDPATALPASVLTRPAEVTSRTRLLKKSATNTLPEAETASPRGELKLLAAPTPSAKPATPLPASVDTAPLGDTKRILWFPVSATTEAPLGQAATPSRELEKAAAAPTPSAHPTTAPPASVEAKREGATMRR